MFSFQLSCRDCQPRRAKPLRWLRAGIFFAILCALVAGLKGSWACPPPKAPDSVETPDAYLFVLDHSGSMQAPGERGKSRWEEVLDHAEETLRQIPLESTVFAIVFASEVSEPKRIPFQTEADREAAVRYFRTGLGKPAGDTKLYDGLGVALDQAASLYRENSQRDVRLIVFSDGADTASKRWTKEKVAEHFARVVEERPNTWLFYTRVGNDGPKLAELIQHPRALEKSLRSPILLKVSADQLFDDAALAPRQTMRWELKEGSPSQWEKLRGLRLKLRYLDSEGKLQIDIPPVELREGVVQVPLSVRNPAELEVGHSYHGVIEWEYPEIKEHDIRGPTRLEVCFQGRPPLEIAVGQDDPLSWNQKLTPTLRNAQGAEKVVWSLNGVALDDQSLTPSIQLGQPGSVQLQVTGHWPGGVTQTAERQLTVKALAPQARFEAIQQSPEWVATLLGQQLQLRDDSLGDIVERRWFINDQEQAQDLTTFRHQSLEPVHIELIVLGPKDATGQQIRDQMEIRISSPFWRRWILPILAGLIGLLVIVIGWPVLYGLQPSGWELTGSLRGLPAADHAPRIQVRKFWRAWSKQAVIPLRYVFPDSEYWSSGAGSKESLIVKLTADKSLSYSGAKSSFVLCSPPIRQGSQGECYRFIDQRCTDPRQQKIFVRLQKGLLRYPWWRIASLVFISIAATLAYWLWMGRPSPLLQFFPP